MHASIFWLTGAAFLAVQLVFLLVLLRDRHRATADPDHAGRRQVEIVWTLVPASLLVALVLMMSGLTRAPWSRVRPDHQPLAERGALPNAIAPGVVRESAIHASLSTAGGASGLR